MDTEELMRQVGRIKILTRKLLDERLIGDYHSIFKGQGVEFDEVRPYEPGDDVRQIDWNVTARIGTPYIKRFCEERELTVLFLVDVSGSQAFGSACQTKQHLAAEVASLLALAAIQNQDKAGLILFADTILHRLSPRRGRTAALRIVREVLAAQATGRQTDLAGALRFLDSVQKRKALVFILSDFQCDGWEDPLRILSRKHDIIACPISAPAESDLPNVGLVELRDPETGEVQLVDTSSKQIREAFQTAARADSSRLAQTFQAARIDVLPLSTERPSLDDVRALFVKRRARRR